MSYETAVILAALWLGVPAELAIAAAELADEPVHHVSYLLSEHPGGRYSGACGRDDACGPYQLVTLWERKYGGDRTDPRDATEIFAKVVERAKAKHGDSWRESIKCNGECQDAVDYWVAQEKRVESIVEVLCGD